MALDRYDRAILDALQRDGRMSNVHLAAASISRNPRACAVPALEESGMIERYVALVNQQARGSARATYWCISACTVRSSRSLPPSSSRP